ncbi:MAG: hypothetical protein GJ680_09980 [Alteromonadaceae bacterium]|nr:hypothetical protein [Alteromonadaceae bacterium]
MLTVAAIVLIFIGLILFPLPVPVGIFFIIGGVALLISVNPKAQKIVRSLRKRHPWINELLHKATLKSPAFLRKILIKTEFKRRSRLNLQQSNAKN